MYFRHVLLVLLQTELVAILSSGTRLMVLGFAVVGIPQNYYNHHYQHHQAQRQQRNSCVVSRRLLQRPQEQQQAQELEQFFLTPNASTTTRTKTPTSGDWLENAMILDLEFHPHRPLGCTLEESLPDSEHVFVTQVKPGSHGEQGGLQVGDVILACSDLFGEDLVQINSAVGGNLVAVIGLISSRPDHESLCLKIARGTNVLQQHEEALVELCSNPGAATSQVEDCLLDYWKQGYDLTDVKSEKQEECMDAENCLLDSVFDLWNQDYDSMLPPASATKSTTVNNDNNSSQQANNKPKPWSSRSSPSGTYVRDPVTGKMRNIDAA